MTERTFTFTESALRKFLHETFDLFFENRDQHDMSEIAAQLEAINTMIEGYTDGMDALREWNEEVRKARSTDDDPNENRKTLP